MIWLIKAIIKRILKNNCPHCKKGVLRYIGDDFTLSTWLSVYECNNCKREFI